MKKLKLFIPIILFAIFNSQAEGQPSLLKHRFLNPPEDSKPSVYWYWMNEHVSKEGITADLESLKEMGLNDAFIGNIYEGGVPGNVQTLSDEWLSCMQHAIKEASRLGMYVSIFNGPGWSQSGGPWVTEDISMRSLQSVSTEIRGGKKIEITIQKPEHYFKDVALLALPMNNEPEINVKKVNSTPNAINLFSLFDKQVKTNAVFENKKDEDVTIDIETSESIVARTIVIKAPILAYKSTVKVYVDQGGKMTEVANEYFDRGFLSPILGISIDGPLVISLPDCTSNSFKIVMSGLPENFQLESIDILQTPLLEKYVEKTLYKMPMTILYDAYMWREQPVSNYSHSIQKNQIIDLSSKLIGDKLIWDAPEGDWKIIRYGMVPTRTVNTPAAASARGLEIDKLSKKAIKLHFDSFVGRVIKGLTPEEKAGVRRVVIDSYEVGPQNWTEDFEILFEQKMGYSPIQYLPVIDGIIIGSAEQSDRFLWDMRKVASDLIAENYIGGLQEIAHQNEMNIWIENYGHWGYPGESLTYSKFADDIAGEYWCAGDAGECKIASSAGNIYGKTKVYAESYTADGNNNGLAFGWYPGLIKHRGDYSFTEGINSVVMHVYIHQPYKDKYPGVNSWFGIEYNNHNTWFGQSKSWIDYQRRCCFMLQQGVPVRDVCFFIGEDAPQMSGWKDPDLSKGYSFDFINADVLMNRVTIKDGKITLPNGLQYSLLALPPLTTMRPELLKKLTELVDQGMVITGNAPIKSPSLTNYPNCDIMVKQYASILWSNDFQNQKPYKQRIGKGEVYANCSINDVLKQINSIEDVKFDRSQNILWTHRITDDGKHIYFISNQNQEEIATEVEFRVKDKIPEFWCAINGDIRNIASYFSTDTSTIVPIKLSGKESVFVVFDRSGSSKELISFEKVYAPNIATIEWENPWTIQFSNQWLGEHFEIQTPVLFDWSTSPDARIKYFSGVATCNSTINFKKIDKTKKHILHLDNVQVIATVRINGKEVGTLWTTPYELNITDYLTNGNNRVELQVVNLWTNRLINDAGKPNDKRNTWTLNDYVKADQKPVSSGVYGNPTIIIKQP